jgi:hypothetical protein
MTSAEHGPLRGLPQTPAERDAQFAVFVADLRAHADDPGEEGDTCRQLLADDPEEVREAWQLGILLQAGSRPPTIVPVLIVVLVVAAVLATVLILWVAP